MGSIGNGRFRGGSGRVIAACVLALAACSAEDGSGGSRGTGNTGTGTDGSSTDPFGNSGATDGSSDPFGNTSGGVAGNGSVIDPNDATCAEGVANANPVTPTVWLIIDSSGSMNSPFGGGTRWQALRSALMDPGGIVEQLQSAARFGMVIYNGPDNGIAQCMGTPNLACGCLFGFEPICCDPSCGGTPPPAPDPNQCANLVTVDPALDNYNTLAAAYPAQEIGGWTPTDRAVQYVVDNLPVLNQVQLDTQNDPVYVILATDGAPNDRCGTDTTGGGFGGGSQFDAVVAQRVIDAEAMGVSQGMRMFVISLAGNDPQLSQHLSDVAAMGNTGSPAFEPTDPQALVQTLQEIIGGASCQVELSGKVMAGQECSGDVTINGFPLPCNDPDGWMLSDERTVKLQGSACDMFLSSPSQVYANFPCGVFVPD